MTLVSAIVLIVISLFLVLGLLRVLISFIRNHRKLFFFIILSLCAFLVFCWIKKPFGELLVLQQKIASYLTKIYHGNTFYSTVCLYVLLVFLAWLVGKIVLSICVKDVMRTIVCSVLSMVVVILTIYSTIYTGVNALVAVFLGEMGLNLLFLAVFKILTLDKIGKVKDVVDFYEKVELANLELGIFGTLISSGVVRIFNDILNTSIPVYLPLVLISALYLLAQIAYFLSITKGCKYITNYARHNNIFCFDDYREADELSYLKDGIEYASSVTDRLALKRKIYMMPFGNRCYLNQQTEKAFEKGIKTNLSSKEIEKRLGMDFKCFGFEKVYRAVFSLVKGYEIEFSQSESSKEKMKNGIGIGATEFVLMRYPIENHPLINEEYDIRADYILALNGLVRRGAIDIGKWEAKLEEYMKVFNVQDLPDNYGSAVNRFSEVVKRKETFVKTVKSDYSYLLLLEAVYFQNLLTEEDIAYREIETIFDLLKITKKHRDFVYLYIKALFIEGDMAAAEKLIHSKVRVDVQRVLGYIHNNLMWNERYVTMNQYKVAVCATMSSGKSTFINAMLGADYIPAKNEACTAKVTTIRDNDNIKNVIGCYRRSDGSKVYSNVINADVLNKWNDDVEVEETILEADIEEISCNDAVLVVHDTPGTNNSADYSHHDRTIEFLKNGDLNLIIYLVNAEYISTNDTEILLKEIQEIAKEKRADIIFGLNKIDCFDEEGGEDIGNAIQGLITQLVSYGFENPVVFPLSANAARLFKLAIKGKDLTKREQRDFARLVDIFTDFDPEKYVINSYKRTDSGTNDMYQKLEKDKTIIVKEDAYSYNQIIEALTNSGILDIENWISEQMRRVSGHNAI